MSTSNDTVLEGVDLVKDFVQGGVTLQVAAAARVYPRAKGGERIAIVGASGLRQDHAGCSCSAAWNLAELAARWASQGIRD